MNLSSHRYDISPISKEAVGGNVKIPTDREFDDLFNANYYPRLLNAMYWRGIREKKTTAHTKPIRVGSPIDFPEQLLGHKFDRIELETTTDYQLNNPTETSFGMALTDSRTGKVVDVFTNDNDNDQIIYALSRNRQGDIDSVISVEPNDFSNMIDNIVMSVSNLQIIPFSNDNISNRLSYLLKLTSVHVEREANYSLANNLESNSRSASSIEQTFSFYESCLEYNKDGILSNRRTTNKGLQVSMEAEFRDPPTTMTQSYYYRRGLGRGKNHKNELCFGVGINGLELNGQPAAGKHFNLREMALRSLRSYSDIRDATQWLNSAMDKVIATDYPNSAIRKLPNKILR